MTPRIDLHTHSTTSDGTDTPAELVAEARAAGLDVVALTDHDTFDGIAEAVAAGERLGVEVLPGMEMSCDVDGRSVHLLAYAPDQQHAELLDELTRIRAGRVERVPTMLRKLAELGCPITEEDVRAQVQDAPSIGRPHIADALVSRGYVADRKEAFDRFLADGGPAYVDRYSPGLERGIELIHAAGGVAVIAHPWGRSSVEVLGEEELGRLVRDHGLDGIEVDHEDHGPAGSSTRARLRVVARDLGILGLGSSDYHGDGKPLRLGANLTDPEQYARLRRRIDARR